MQVEILGPPSSPFSPPFPFPAPPLLSTPFPLQFLNQRSVQGGKEIVGFVTYQKKKIEVIATLTGGYDGPHVGKCLTLSTLMNSWKSN